MNSRLFSPRRQRQHGLTLVELMVAVVMGFVLLAGIITVFVANRQTYRMQEAVARGQEAGRFATTILARDIRQAGYFGCAARRRIPILNTLNPSGNSYNWDYGVAIQGFTAAAWDAVPAYPVALDQVVGTDGVQRVLSPKPVPGSDVLTVRSAGGCGDTVTEHNQPSADLKLSPRACLCEGDIVLITDCVTGVIFQATNVTPDPCLGKGNSGVKTNVVHADGKGLARKLDPGNATKDLGQTWVGGEIVKVESTTYYVGDTGRNPDATGRGVRALYRTVNGRPAEELVEGIENLQVSFGEDEDGNLAVTAAEYVATHGAVGRWTDVRAVQVSLLVHSADRFVTDQPQTVRFVADFGTNAVGDVNPKLMYGTDDNRFRQVFTTVVGSRNQLP